MSTLANPIYIAYSQLKGKRNSSALCISIHRDRFSQSRGNCSLFKESSPVQWSSMIGWLFLVYHCFSKSGLCWWHRYLWTPRTESTHEASGGLGQVFMHRKNLMSSRKVIFSILRQPIKPLSSLNWQTLLTRITSICKPRDVTANFREFFWLMFNQLSVQQPHIPLRILVN